MFLNLTIQLSSNQRALHVFFEIEAFFLLQIPHLTVHPNCLQKLRGFTIYGAHIENMSRNVNEFWHPDMDENILRKKIPIVSLWTSIHHSLQYDLPISAMNLYYCQLLAIVYLCDWILSARQVLNWYTKLVNKGWYKIFTSLLKMH